MNRQQLTDAILGWLHRASVRPPSGSLDPIGAWIALGEADINLDLRARCMVQRATQPVDGQYVPLPCDYLEALDLRIAAPPAPAPVPTYVGRELIYQPRREMGDAVAWTAGGVYALDPPGTYYDAGGPRHYSIVGDKLEILPLALPPTLPPDPLWQPYYIEMSYYGRQVLGPELTDTTPVLSAYSGAYLYAALTHAAPFMRDGADRLAAFQGQYQAVVYRANAEHERARHQGSRILQRYRRAAV